MCTVNQVYLSTTSCTYAITVLPRSEIVVIFCTGLRGSLEVRNELNVPASFQWHARDGVDTSVFFMVHPNGTYVWVKGWRGGEARW